MALGLGLPISTVGSFHEESRFLEPRKEVFAGFHVEIPKPCRLVYRDAKSRGFFKFSPDTLHKFCRYRMDVPHVPSAESDKFFQPDPTGAI